MKENYEKRLTWVSMTLQQEVIKRLRCKPEINVKEEIRLTVIS